jgi:arylformamidase
MLSSAQAHDRMYNNRALVPDFADHLNHWAVSSRQARDTSTCLTDLSYGDGPNETLDIFPAKAEKAPVMVFIHGGYWRALDKSDHSFVAPPFTQEGLCVVVPNYALCPAVNIPTIVMQMVKALAWVKRHIAQWGGDPESIHVVGHSAGGHLAAMMMACQWSLHEPDLPDHLIRSALCISGLFELDSIRQSPMLQADLRLDEDQVMRCSPAWMPPPAHGTCWSVVGGLESEAFIRHHRLIQTAWGLQRVPVCEVMPGLHHFNVLTSLTDPSSRLHQMALSLMKGT